MINLLEHIPYEFKHPTEKFRKALENMGILYWYLNIADSKVMLSPELRMLLDIKGDSFEESVNKMKKLVHPDDIGSLESNQARILDGKEKVLEADMRFNVKGDWVWYYVRGSVLANDGDDNPLIMGGITMDISKRYVRMLDRIEEARKFEFVFKSAVQPVFVGRISMTEDPSEIIEVNRAACELLQATERDLVGMSTHDIIYEPLKNFSEEMRAQFIKNGVFFRETKLITLKGEKRYVEINAHSFEQNRQQLFIAIVNDKTESHMIRHELKASEFAFRRNEKIYKTLIHAADDRIALFDLDGKIEIMNDAYFTTLGYTQEEFIQLGMKEDIHPDDLSEVNMVEKELREEGFLAYHYRVKHKAGYYLHMSAKGVRIKDAELDKVFLLFIIRDITDQVEFADELIRAKEQAEESEILKSAFLANISHEIRTPMNSIVGFANLLSEDGLSPSDKKEYVARINKNSGQLLALISDIIDLAKIESNQLSISFSKVYVDQMLQEALTFARNQLRLKGRKGLDIEYDPDPQFGNPVMDSDFVRIMQIMQNLVSNAIKFTLEGFVKVGFRIIDENKIQLFVKDSGPGIKP
ncbi:MAG TPA: PAS domain S-box protein, partial [Bacteroidales bacterium]|nr:PAS domain S-box protein [Bacteroidales bacterium]